MLTCEDIAAQVQAMGLPVNRGNYHAIAERIHPRVRQPVFDRSGDDDTDPAEDMEWCEHYRAGKLPRTEDWTHMVVSLVTLWQWWVKFQPVEVSP